MVSFQLLATPVGRGRNRFVTAILKEGKLYYVLLIHVYLNHYWRKFFLSILANNVNELPNILEQPQDEFVVGGQQATLSCVSTVPPSQFYGIVWKKDGQLLKETNRCKYRREHISSYTIRATYTISQARPEDRGMYTAEISTCIHSISSKAGYLDVRWDFCYWPFSSTPYCDRILH